MVEHYYVLICANLAAVCRHAGEREVGQPQPPIRIVPRLHTRPPVSIYQAFQHCQKAAASGPTWLLMKDRKLGIRRCPGLKGTCNFFVHLARLHELLKGLARLRVLFRLKVQLACRFTVRAMFPRSCC